MVTNNRTFTSSYVLAGEKEHNFVLFVGGYSASYLGLSWFLTEIAIFSTFNNTNQDAVAHQLVNKRTAAESLMLHSQTVKFKK